MSGPVLGLRAIFEQAFGLESPVERERYLADVCSDRVDLREEVEGLLRAHGEVGSFLEGSDLIATALWDNPAGPEAPGAAIGPYALGECLGAGGMGVVYRAEQTEPVRRTVALKLIKPGMDSAQVVARFEAERQALAIMDHPSIARVLDAGATETGRPYFVMELVEGVPITDYCDRVRLPIRDRLELFVLVCRAVQHAHQKGVIHRDLKPSNVLVVEQDGVPVPKVIDFGVAKAIRGETTVQATLTGVAQLVGTPLYMSPEQAELDGHDIDTRTDVYSLGVLLYVLLTGTMPFEPNRLKQAPLGELCRIIREEEPARPSTRLSTLTDADRSGISESRRTDPRHLARALHGELDWIVLKCLEKDRARRYESAGALAEDLMRFLTDRPVEAGPPSPWYRCTKFARRNRAALLTGGLVALALLVGTAVSTWQAVRARQAETQARASAIEARLNTERADQVLRYLVDDIFGAALLSRPNGQSATIQDLLDQADAMIAERFRGQPVAEARCRMALSEIDILLFRNERGLRHARRAVALMTAALGPEHPETLAARAALIYATGAEWGKEETQREVVQLSRVQLTTCRRVVGPAHPLTIEATYRLADSLHLLGQLDEAEALVGPALALAGRVYGPRHRSTLDAGRVLAIIANARGQHARAAALMRPVVEGRRAELGPLHPLTIFGLGDLAMMVRKQGHADEALRLNVEILDLSWRAFGPTHALTSGALHNVIELHRDAGDVAAVRGLCEGWIRSILANPPGPDPDLRERYTFRLAQLARTLALLPAGAPIDAALAARAADEVAAIDGGRSIRWSRLALVYYRAGRLADAEAALRAARAGARPRDLDVVDMLILTMIETQRGHPHEARAWYGRARDQADPPNVRPEDIQSLRDEAADVLGLVPALMPAGPAAFAR